MEESVGFFWVNAPYSNLHIWRPLGERFDNKYLVAIVKHPPRQTIWGAMSCHGAAGLYLIPPNAAMNVPKYVESLKEKLKLHMHVNGSMIFMQDGAPCHKLMVATEFLKINEISEQEMPGNSPDFSPIENLWTIMTDNVT